jgi:hypothetical protein
MNETTLTRIKVLTSHAAHARYLAEEPENAQPIGTVQRPAHIPSPYHYAPAYTVWDHAGIPIVIFETRHKRYEVYRVDGPLGPVEEG